MLLLSRPSLSAAASVAPLALHEVWLRHVYEQRRHVLLGRRRMHGGFELDWLRVRDCLSHGLSKARLGEWNAVLTHINSLLPSIQVRRDIIDVPEYALLSQPNIFFVSHSHFMIGNVLLKKQDIIMEEYSFTVPAILCEPIWS